MFFVQVLSEGPIPLQLRRQEQNQLRVGELFLGPIHFPFQVFKTVLPFQFPRRV